MLAYKLDTSFDVGSGESGEEWRWSWGKRLGVVVKGANFARLLHVGKQPPSAHKISPILVAHKTGATAVFSSLIDGNSFMGPPAFSDVYLLDYEALKQRPLVSFTVGSFMAS